MQGFERSKVDYTFKSVGEFDNPETSNHHTNKGPQKAVWFEESASNFTCHKDEKHDFVFGEVRVDRFDETGPKFYGYKEGNYNFENQIRKLKMPVFGGDDAYRWIYRVVGYSTIRAIVHCCSLYGRWGTVLVLLEWRKTPFYSREGLKRRLILRLKQTQGGNLYEQFLAISQEGTTRDYVAIFEKLARQLVGILQSVLEETFIKGLKPDLTAAVRAMKPESLAMRWN